MAYGWRRPRYSPGQEKVRIEESTLVIRPAQRGDEAGPEVKAAIPRLPTTTSLHGEEAADRGRRKPATEKPAKEIRSSHVLPSIQTQILRHPGPADSRRRNQISIGRIDVQVNNQAPPQPAEARPANVPARLNSLEQRYLGRFFLGF